MTEKDVTIQNRAGIHARPAAMIVQTASKFQSSIHLSREDEKINAKSIMGIITLGAGYQTVLTVSAEGDDESEAVDAIVGLFEKKFEEE
ncbi:HPr family phosphocarrier protein [Spirochaeta africana]|uniref:Phosphotransferase system HPr (HPr) family protein n=1 Tax=Spirochaeta africana (strain ATCC 700263 / DSM 8902 / Z-7692) TaxID=889378 RepID=H9UMF1_SPIAZ|nr:HPr family phosphocarrier protein [Spirochaeta africana]AFG38694.1 phosphotransferase system HPr (HPr) family protein [Spirochaeta africana DSM 8902]